MGGQKKTGQEVLLTLLFTLGTSGLVELLELVLAHFFATPFFDITHLMDSCAVYITVTKTRVV